MGFQGKPILDLNELPEDVEEDIYDNCSFQPQKTIPFLHAQKSDFLSKSLGPKTIPNNNAFSHAPSHSGFQPFVRPKNAHGSEDEASLRKTIDLNSLVASPSSHEETIAAAGSLERKPTEREEGEWSDTEGSAVDNISMHEHCKISEEHGKADSDHGLSSPVAEDIASRTNKSNIIVDDNSKLASSGSNSDSPDHKRSDIQNSEEAVKNDMSLDGQVKPGLTSKLREVKGVKAIHALRVANIPGKKYKHDHQKEMMLGKKRSRQTMFLNLEDIKQAGPIKMSTPRRQNFPTPIITRTVKENRTVPQHGLPLVTGQKQDDILSNGVSAECSELEHE